VSLTDKQALTDLAMKLASNVSSGYSGRWCFFAGFAYILNGVEKNTHDIDVLTKDNAAYEHMLSLLPHLGFQLVSATNDFSSFKAGVSDQVTATNLGLDLLCITNPLLRNLGGMWTELEIKKVKGAQLPIPQPMYLILLKIIVNSQRQLGDKKREQDFYDVQQLMSKKRITSAQLIKEAKNQGLEDLTRKFLDKLKSMKK
jgi:hypothetical protein